ncbi:electron transport complex subunit RsxC [Colwellia sp. 6M3]|uniref:electron transport complex subunit RsxC n=1 Tax=Colwellia sp. 6M3 TaxID=2759849 RepID=UPI0015F69297|nr:electron transport complex subunit RsxC [Colwellia sp. 6M3]MBA6415325.1 electron transport complex subunit RsxC [Colwellia sp. 6M3]
MESVIERIKRGSFWHFHGGIHPPEQKFLTSTKPIASAQIPEQLIIPLRQHIGQAGKLIVNVGDKVLKGQALSVNDSPMSLSVHAPTSGTITAIKLMAIPHPSGLSETCIILTPDGEDTWQSRQICPDYKLLSKEKILEKIANAGIAGMGGAGFPTQIKVSTLAKINYLIINAAECEPYITADDLLIQEHSPTILDGIKIIDHLLSPKNILIGIEDNKPKAIDVLQKATANIEHIQVCVIPTKYPSGGEKQLIQILTGQEVPSGVLPSSLGIVMQNVATCFAIADAVINDTPLIKRVVTISGQALEKPQNVWALIGTPVGFLTNQCGYQNSEKRHLIMGGPMMGFSLPHDQVPIIKSTNCILAPSEIEIASPFSSTSSKEVECIRCGQCADVCPAQLLPQELQWSAKAKDQPQLAKLNLFDCIECGACAYVCPSQIPLVHYYRVAKAEIRQQKLLDIKAEKAKVRFEARKLRLEREKVARAEKHKKAADARKARMNSGTTAAKSEKSAVADALERVKAKKAQASLNATAPQTPESEATSTEEVSESKSKVANAIARAKAKKLAQKKQDQMSSLDTLQDNETSSSLTEVQPAPVVIDKKAKVAAAIAKAKAKKHQKDSLSNSTVDQSNTSTNTQVNIKASEPTTVSLKIDTAEKASAPDAELSQPSDKKAKIAAAIAKAKVKKRQKDAVSDNAVDQSDASTNTQVKAEASEPETVSLKIDTAEKDVAADEELSQASNKKAKIAAAIAKAKLKAQAKSEHKLNTDKTPQSSTISTTKATLSQESTSTNEAEHTEHLAEKSEQSEQQTLVTNNTDIDRKAKIAAAVAKAKAKKMAVKSQQASIQSSEKVLNEADSNNKQDAENKRARVAAAVAKAKAKKLAASSDKSSTSE